jgi:hemolysin activation/secretion protein
MRGIIVEPSIVILALLGIAASPALLAATPVIPAARLPGVVDRPPPELPPSITEEKADVPVQPPQPLPPAEPGEPVATIKRIIFGGTLLLKEEELQAVVAPFLNRPLTRQDVAQMKYELTKKHFDEGYVLAKVTTPPQDISDGVMKVVIILGRIGQIDISNDALRDGIASSRAAPIRSGEVFNERTVESALQDINDLTNIQSQLSLRPGAAVGTTDVDLKITEADQDVQMFLLDNYGSELTGTNVAELRLQKSNLLRMGETFGIRGRHSNEELWGVEANAAVPLPVHNLKLEMDYLYSENDIGDILSALDSTGESQRAQVALSSALINQRRRKAVLRGGVEWGKFESYLSSRPETEDTISKLFVEASYTMRTQRLVSFASIRVNKGVGMLGADNEGEADASRIDGDPRAWIIEPLLYLNVRVTPKDYIQFTAQGQIASETLLASDLFALGGYGSIRGFEPAQITGEDGASVTFEYGHQFNITPKWFIQAGPFLDIGFVDNEKSNSVPVDNLKSAGIGGEAVYRHSSRHATILRFDWAHPLGDSDLPLVDQDSFYGRLTQTF